MKLIDKDATDLAVVKCTTYGDALRAVRSVPIIEIVQCKDCRYWDGTMCINEFGLWDTARLDDFCSYGERRSDEL